MIYFNELISNFDKLSLTNLPTWPCVKKPKLNKKNKIRDSIKTSRHSKTKSYNKYVVNQYKRHPRKKRKGVSSSSKSKIKNDFIDDFCCLFSNLTF